MFLELALGNSFGTWYGYLVGVSLDKLARLMIVTGEGFLVGLSLGLPLGSPLKSTNIGADLPIKILGAPLRLSFGYSAFRCWCCCRCLIYFCKATCWGVGTSCLPPYGAFITSNINSVRYFQLLELLTLAL